MRHSVTPAPSTRHPHATAAPHRSNELSNACPPSPRCVGITSLTLACRLSFGSSCSTALPRSRCPIASHRHQHHRHCNCHYRHRNSGHVSHLFVSSYILLPSCSSFCATDGLETRLDRYRRSAFLSPAVLCHPPCCNYCCTISTTITTTTTAAPITASNTQHCSTSLLDVAHAIASPTMRLPPTALSTVPVLLATIASSAATNSICNVAPPYPTPPPPPQTHPRS